MDRSKAQLIWDIQASEQSARDAKKYSGGQIKFFGFVFMLFLAVWFIDHVLIQLQIWYHQSATWMAETVPMFAVQWPF